MQNIYKPAQTGVCPYRVVFYCIVVGSRRLMPRTHFSRRLIVQTLVFSRSYLHCQVFPPETLVVKGGNTWARNGRWILTENARLPLTFRDLLHAVNLRHGTDGFTSPPKKGVLRIFSPWKIRRLRPGLNPRTWVPKASTLPLDHRSRFRTGLQHTVVWYMGTEFPKVSILYLARRWKKYAPPKHWHAPTTIRSVKTHKNTILY